MKEGVMDTSTTSLSRRTTTATTPTKTSTPPTIPTLRKDYKVILVGDSQCGKSSLLKRYTKRTFTEAVFVYVASDIPVSYFQCAFASSTAKLLGRQHKSRRVVIDHFSERVYQDYVPTVFDSGSADIVSDQNNDIKLNIWDTSGSPEFDHIRPLSYNDAAVFLLCFDLEKPTTSLENIRNRWILEIKQLYSDTPIILVGCKSDLRSDSKDFSSKNKNNTVTCQQGMTFSKVIAALGYLECSSKNQDHSQKIEKLFQVAAMLATGQLNKVPKEMKPRDQSIQKSKQNCSIM